MSLLINSSPNISEPEQKNPTQKKKKKKIKQAPACPPSCQAYPTAWTTPATGLVSSVRPFVHAEGALLSNAHLLVPSTCANRRVTCQAHRRASPRNRMLLLSSCMFPSLFCSNLAFPVPSLFNKSQMQTTSLNLRNSSSLLRK